MTVQEAVKGAHLLESHLTSMRNECTYNCFNEQTVQESRPLTEEPKLPKNQKFQIEKIVGHLHHISIHVQRKDRYCQIYNEAIDIATEEVKRQIDQSDIRMIREIMSLLLKFANGNF